MTDEWQDNPFYQRDSYLEWVATEGVPIVEAYAVDCLTQPLEPAQPPLRALGHQLRHAHGRARPHPAILQELDALEIPLEPGHDAAHAAVAHQDVGAPA